MPHRRDWRPRLEFRRSAMSCSTGVVGVLRARHWSMLRASCNQNVSSSPCAIAKLRSSAHFAITRSGQKSIATSARIVVAIDEFEPVRVKLFATTHGDERRAAKTEPVRQQRRRSGPAPRAGLGTQASARTREARRQAWPAYRWRAAATRLAMVQCLDGGESDVGPQVQPLASRGRGVLGTTSRM